MREFSGNDNYIVKEMDRPKEIVNTIHGKFKIITFDPLKNDLRPTCYQCFYKNHKVTGAPCVEGKWCGGLYSSLVPIRLNEEGVKLQNAKVAKATKRQAQ